MCVQLSSCLFTSISPFGPHVPGCVQKAASLLPWADGLYSWLPFPLLHENNVVLQLLLQKITYGWVILCKSCANILLLSKSWARIKNSVHLLGNCRPAASITHPLPWVMGRLQLLLWGARLRCYWWWRDATGGGDSCSPAFSKENISPCLCHQILVLRNQESTCDAWTRQEYTSPCSPTVTLIVFNPLAFESIRGFFASFSSKPQGYSAWKSSLV